MGPAGSHTAHLQAHQVIHFLLIWFIFLLSGCINHFCNNKWSFVTILRGNHLHLTFTISSDGKFVFKEQKASLVLGWLPQELLGSSVYEYFYPDDILGLADTHRQTLTHQRTHNTQPYRFRTKEGSFVKMENVWRTFKNPWTKEVVYITSNNSLVLSEAGLVESTIANDVIPTKSSFPGGFNELLGDGSYHNLTDATLGEGRRCGRGGSAGRSPTRSSSSRGAATPPPPAPIRPSRVSWAQPTSWGPLHRGGLRLQVLHEQNFIRSKLEWRNSSEDHQCIAFEFLKFKILRNNRIACNDNT